MTTESFSNEPDYRRISSLEIILGIIREAGSDGIMLPRVTTAVEAINAKRAQQSAGEQAEFPNTIDPGLPDSEQVEAILAELEGSGRVKIENGRIYYIKN